MKKQETWKGLDKLNPTITQERAMHDLDDIDKQKIQHTETINYYLELI
tara:strand:+ start:269 stop:412 length:144 start_codon:yes stop_codon:yes gene_type:complete